MREKDLVLSQAKAVANRARGGVVGFDQRTGLCSLHEESGWL